MNGSGLLRSLQYFDAVAKHRSMKLAARDLGVSESAVSHQMRGLSEVIGRQLLVKNGRSIALTSAGEDLASRIGKAFAGLDELVRDLSGATHSVLQLAVCSSFGPYWLIDRLDSFYAAHSEIDLELRLYAQDPSLSNDVADAFVTAYPVRPGFAAIRIFDEMLVAVHSPKFVTRRGAPKHRLITTDLEFGRLGQEWSDYCEYAGIVLKDLQEGSFRRCSHYLLAIEMAKANQGIALVPEFIAAKHLASGALQRFGQLNIPSNRTYHLCYKQSRKHEAHISSFAKWIKTQTTSNALPSGSQNKKTSKRTNALQN